MQLANTPCVKLVTFSDSFISKKFILAAMIFVEIIAIYANPNQMIGVAKNITRFPKIKLVAPNNNAGMKATAKTGQINNHKKTPNIPMIAKEMLPVILFSKSITVI